MNDAFGHPAGDELLKRVARRISGVLEGGDSVARFGSDEFVVRFEDIGDADHAGRAVARVLETFTSPFDVGGHEVSATASVGVSLYPDDADNAASLVRNADAAMSGAKDEGRNSVQFYTRDLTDRAFEHVFLENALRAALDRDEFRLVYQPQIRFADGSVAGVEALIRWHHPDQGVISPARFIPIAEQSGLIREIGEWVLRQACSDARRWLDAGLPFGRVAVNVAGPQLQTPDFAERVSRVLADTGLPPSALELEVTETFVMDGTDSSVARLDALRAIGVAVAIDDFGTGYSSLAYLKRLPVQNLKIDQSFVRDLPGSGDDGAIVTAIVRLGHALGMHITAEGVETEAQASFLRALGCEFAQGYFYARPLDTNALEAFVRSTGQRGTVS